MKVSYYKNYVSKDLKSIHPNDRKIFKHFLEFAKIANPPIIDLHIKSIKGYSNLFRHKKMGKKIRIVFYMENDIVLIIAVAYRNEFYKKL